MAPAKLIYKRKTTYSDGTIVEMTIWELLISFKISRPKGSERSKAVERDFRIEIKCPSLEEMGDEFIQVWHAAEQGETPRRPIERVCFENLKVLVQTLTPKRIQVLTVLHEEGPSAIRALAKKLRRDYKNVHQDIQILERVGLVEETKEGLVAAPFKKIVAEIQLAA
jgi:predicted transcriptional regulator